MRYAPRQLGTSLIEILVAIAVFSVGMAGVALMQVKGAQHTRQAGVRAVAVLQARSLAEAMRANPAGVWGVATMTDIAARHGDVSGSYYLFRGDGVDSAGSCANQACATAKRDLAQWVVQLRQAATPPGGAVKLANVELNAATGMLSISIHWKALGAERGEPAYESYAFDYQP